MTKQIQFNRTGSAEVLEIVNVNVQSPKADEVQIRMQALGLNRAEIMYRNGQYVIEPVFPATMDYEGTGMVEAVGRNVKNIVVGDKVSVIPSLMFTEYGTYAEVANLPVHAVVKHPENLSFEQAAASWMMFVTAYGALIELSNLQAGEFVLLNAATSSVGLAAIQIAKKQGATVIAMSRTHKKGVDLVFDPVGGKDAAKIFNAMAFDDRL